MNEKKQFPLKNHNQSLNKIVKESLQQALIILMNRKPFASITITELCKKAGVSRMAFYSNYHSKEELLRKIVLDSIERLLDKIGSPFRQSTGIDWYEQMFENIKEDAFSLKTIFNAGFKEEYFSIINEMVLHDATVSPENKYLRIIWAGGMANVIMQWVEAGSVEPTKEIAKFCYDNMSVWAN